MISNTELNKRIAKNLYVLRIRNRISTVELSRDLDMDRTKIHKMESGKTTKYTLYDILKFCEYYGFSIKFLCESSLELTDSEIEKYRGEHPTGMTFPTYHKEYVRS